MNKHVATATVVPFRKPLEGLRPDQIVDAMAAHIVAAVLHASLDTSRDQDVIQVLLDAPERYHHRVVLDHMDAALFEAKQILIAKEIGDE